MTDQPDVWTPPPLLSPRQRTVLPYVVLVLVLLVAGLVLVRHFAGGGKQASAGALIYPTDPIPVSKHWDVLLPGTRLDAAVTIRSSVPDDLAARTFDAPDDGRFVGLQVTESADAAPYVPIYGSAGGVGPTINLQLVADGHPYPLRTSEYVDDDSTDVPLAVYVPVAGDPSTLLLKVTQAGRSQTIDLRTGKRNAGDYAALYSQRTSHPVSCGTPQLSKGYSTQYADATCRYQVDRVPYVYGPGWAPKGRVWLNVQVSTGQPGGVLVHPTGAAPAAYYVDALGSYSPADRLDNAKPIRRGNYVGYDVFGTSTQLLYSVPASGDPAHTLTALQQTRALARVDSKRLPFEVTVTETWTVRIP